MGKSRLIAEWTTRVDNRALVLEGRSLSIGHSLSFHPFTDLFRHWLELGEDDGAEAALARLDPAAVRLFGDEAGDVVPFIATLMGLRLTGAHAERVRGIEGEALEKLIFKSVRKLFRRLALERPLVLLFEDLHWADQSSIELLDSLLRLVTESAVLFVHVFRPDSQTSGEFSMPRGAPRPAADRGRLPPRRRQWGRLIQNLLPAADFPITLRR
jgi:predicted ATPase